MKRLFFVLAFAGIAGGALAQDDTSTYDAGSETIPTDKYSVATNSFWSNWFLQVGATYNAFYDNGEIGKGFDKSPFKSFRSTPGLSVALGKWFTPGLGLRTRLDGFWGRKIAGEDKEPNKIHYFMVNEQVLFNLSNLFAGYNENRVWNLSLYGGAGFARNMSENQYSMTYTSGLLSTWRLSSWVNLFLDAQAAMGEQNDFSGIPSTVDFSDGKSFSKRVKNHDWIFTAEVGLSFNLGKNRFKKVPDVDALLASHKAQLDDLNARLRNAEDENANLKNQLANQPEQAAAPAATKEFAGSTYSVFFSINSAKIVSHKDVLNLQSVADFAKANSDATIVVDGYADSKTGSADFNQKLSTKRAQTVADRLVEMGVSSSQIQVNGLGGVNDVDPYKYNRRAIVSVK